MKSLLHYLTLGVIVPLPLPNQIANGQTADSGPVMANLNYIANQVNANVTPTSTYIAAGGVGGTANAITLTPAPAIAAYTDGLTYTFLPTNTNTGATTIAVSALSAVPVLDGMGVAGALSGRELSTLQPTTIVYVASIAAFKIISPPAGFRVAWTPTLTFGGFSVGMTYGTRQGYLTKFGSIVFMTLGIALTNKGSSTGPAAIGPLPFNADISIQQDCIFNMQGSGLTFSAGYNVGVLSGASNINLYNQSTGGALSSIQDGNFSNTTSLVVSGTYSV